VQLYSGARAKDAERMFLCAKIYGCMCKSLSFPNHCLVLFYSGSRAKDAERNASDSQMMADDAYRIAEEIEV
jgi:hypothetical protein